MSTSNKHFSILKIQRFVILLVLATISSAADPIFRPYPDGPILTISVPDISTLRLHFAASWYGTLWSLPANAPIRKRLSDLVGDAEHMSGITLGDLGAHLRSIELLLGKASSMRLALDEPAAPLLAGVAAAAERDKQEEEDRSVALREYYIKQRRGLVSGFGPRPLPIIPCEPIGEGVIIGRSRPHYSHPIDDGIACIPRGMALICGTPTEHPSGAAEIPITTDVSLIADLPDLADALGIPGFGDSCRHAGFGRAVGTLSIADGGSHESLFIPGAQFPLRPVDMAVLEAEVPPGTIALSVIGIDGTALAAFAHLAISSDPVAADMLSGSDAALREIDGTAWMAVVSGQYPPDVVVGFPAGKATDAWLLSLLPYSAKAIGSAGKEVASVRLQWSGTTWSIRRTPRAWLFATSDSALNQQGTPGLAARLANEIGIPGGVMALAYQDNPTILRQLSGIAALASIGMKVRALTGHEDDIPFPFTPQDFLTAVTAISQMGAVPGVQATVAWLATNGHDVELTGRNLLVGSCIFPTAAIFAGGIQLSDIVGAGRMLWSYSGLGNTFVVPFTFHQVKEIAQSSPIPTARAWALERLFYSGPGLAADEFLPWWRAGLANPDRDIRLGAIRGVRYGTSVLAMQKTHFPEDVLHLAESSLQDSDTSVRSEAAETLSQASIMSHAQSLGLLTLPDSTLESMLTAYHSEKSAEVLSPLITALSMFDDPRIKPLLLNALVNPDVNVRARAVGALGQNSTTGSDGELVATFAKMRSDQSPINQHPWTLGNAARLALYSIDSPAATAAIAAELDAPELPSAGPEPWLIYGIWWKTQTITTLVRRNYPGALRRAVALVDDFLSPSHGDFFDPTSLVMLAQCLGSVKDIEAEGQLVKLVLHPDMFVSSTAAKGLENHAKIHALADGSIQALIQALTMSQSWGRISARIALDLSKLSDQQRQEVAKQIAQAEATFGAQAFQGYEPPTPKAPPVKPVMSLRPWI